MFSVLLSMYVYFVKIFIYIFVCFFVFVYLCLQCITTGSSTETSSRPTCCWGTTVTSRSQTSAWATSSRGRTPSCPARRGRRPSWLQRRSAKDSRASVERWGGRWLIHLNTFHLQRKPQWWWHIPSVVFVCSAGVRRVGDGSHAVLFRLWKGNLTAVFTHSVQRWQIVFTFTAFVPLQCPFYDEYIVSLHNKIKSKPVEFPPT